MWSKMPFEYFTHTNSKISNMYSASEEEIRKAVMKAAEVCNWNTILNGNQVNRESFKSEFYTLRIVVERNFVV